MADFVACTLFTDEGQVVACFLLAMLLYIFTLSRLFCAATIIRKWQRCGVGSTTEDADMVIRALNGNGKSCCLLCECVLTRCLLSFVKVPGPSQ